MGEYAEMMLDGTCCAACGEYMGDGDGFASYCSPECARDHDAEYYGIGDGLSFLSEPGAECDICGKVCADTQGLAQHKAAKHGIKPQVCPDCGQRVGGGKLGMQQHRESIRCQRRQERRKGGKT